MKERKGVDIALRKEGNGKGRERIKKGRESKGIEENRKETQMKERGGKGRPEGNGL